jgi:hypothetical protein
VRRLLLSAVITAAPGSREFNDLLMAFLEKNRL